MKESALLARSKAAGKNGCCYPSGNCAGSDKPPPKGNARHLTSAGHVRGLLPVGRPNHESRLVRRAAGRGTGQVCVLCRQVDVSGTSRAQWPNGPWESEHSRSVRRSARSGPHASRNPVWGERVSPTARRSRNVRRFSEIVGHEHSFSSSLESPVQQGRIVDAETRADGHRRRPCAQPTYAVVRTCSRFARK